jgi:hypothetical protein
MFNHRHSLELRSGLFAVVALALASGCAFEAEDADANEAPAAQQLSIQGHRADGELDANTECASPRLRRAFAEGQARGERHVRGVWRRFGSCGRVDAFADAIMQNLEEREGGHFDTGLRAQCRSAGVAEGVFAELERIQSTCADRCFLTGERVGALKARAYCERMIETGGELAARAWVRRPVATCGLNYQLGCDAAFLGETREYENELGACLPYTRGEFSQVWTDTRLRVCDYSRRSGCR